MRKPKRQSGPKEPIKPTYESEPSNTRKPKKGSEPGKKRKPGYESGPKEERKPHVASEPMKKRKPCDLSAKKEKRKMENNDKQAIRMLVRLREDFQAMRKRMDNRLGRKANGKRQNVLRSFRAEDIENFTIISDEAKKQEKEIEKMLRKTLKRFPVYNEFLKDVKGVGEISAGWIIGEFDIHEATTISKLWQFSGLNPGMVIGKKRIENKDGTFSYMPTNKMVRGDRLTPGFVAPFNKRLRTALVGVMADVFIKCQNDYCMKFYYPYKLRLESEENLIQNEDDSKAWKDVSKGRRDRAAKRYMVKMFLKDLYVAWRSIEGLEVRKPYHEEYLGHKH